MSSESHVVSAKTWRSDWVLLALLSVSLASNVFLAFALNRVTAQSSGGVRAQSPQMPSVGSRVPALDVHRLDGIRTTVEFGDVSVPTFIYVFSPSCKWCERNLDNLRVITEAAGAGKVRLIGVSLEPNPASYINEKGLGFPVYVKPSSRTLTAYGLGVTPQTFVVSPSGVLQAALSGAYTGAVQTTLEELLGVTLPGLTFSSR